MYSHRPYRVTPEEEKQMPVGKRTVLTHIARHKRNNAVGSHEPLKDVKTEPTDKKRPQLFRVPATFLTFDETLAEAPLKKNWTRSQVWEWRLKLPMKVVCPNCHFVHRIKTKLETHTVQFYETFFGKMMPEGAPQEMSGRNPIYKPIQCRCKNVIAHPDWKAPEKMNEIYGNAKRHK